VAPRDATPRHMAPYGATPRHVAPRGAMWRHSYNLMVSAVSFEKKKKIKLIIFIEKMVSFSFLN
jgi:hypothetical protein